MLQAHGLGGASDLPIPANLAIAGGSAALTISFIVLLFAWRRPRYTQPLPAVGRGTNTPPAPGEADRGLSVVSADAGIRVPTPLARLVDSAGFAAGLRVLGLVFFAYTVWAAVAGPDSLINPTFGVVFVLLWVGIVPASLLFGPFFRAVSPARTIHLLVHRLVNRGADPARHATRDERGQLAGLVPGHTPGRDAAPKTDGGALGRLPGSVGYWPAAVGLLAFVWLELVYPDANYLAPVRLWFALYLVFVVMGGLLFGTRWVARADPFEVYSTLVGHLSVWARRPDGTLVLASPLRNLAGLRGEPGLVAVVAILLGSTAFDSFRGWNFWLRFSQSTDANMVLVNTAVLVGLCVVVGVMFAAATAATGVDQRTPRWQLPGVFAHSVVPIIVGYMVAHYLTLFVEFGQQTLIQLSDPMGTGANLLGTAGGEVNYWLSNHPTFLASTKVLAIVTGHVLGVIAAHDRALAVLPKRHHLTGQLPLLCVMVLYTFAGLYLLFGA
ncbi:hypothetical protein [Nocardioides sp. Arc9.136]|uniref:hypothetical protein n=1 Tax=Nocardioides sp. Arc9.136 TaxID=2996826 RepID=UPI002665B47F|nr:hypothetical protein [Nocardioides sp. Arc9.136]WKN46624.1 hypothetical protein OSR43_11235 [Nocardioides sp. Arc9.136]